MKKKKQFKRSRLQKIKKENLEVKEIDIPDNLKEIKDHQFEYNVHITRAIIPDGVTSIGSFAFTNCSSLKEVYIACSVNKIGGKAFFFCSNLSKVSYAGTKQEFENIKKGFNYLASCATKKIMCLDGELEINPYK